MKGSRNFDNPIILLRHSTPGTRKISKPQLHLVDTLILRFYYKQSHLKWTDIYRIGQRVLERTHCLWVDPAKAPEDQLQSLVAELLNNEFQFKHSLKIQKKLASFLRSSYPHELGFIHISSGLLPDTSKIFEIPMVIDDLYWFGILPCHPQPLKPLCNYRISLALANHLRNINGLEQEHVTL